MLTDLVYPNHMGPRLRAEVERQLLLDFQHYAHEQSDHLAIDWSDTCPEGHATAYLDGWVENWSGVWVVNAQGKRIAWGWIEFIHGGGDHPLFVFWHYLHFGENTEDVVQVDLCLTSETYDAKWGNDPLVLQWRNQKSQ